MSGSQPPKLTDKEKKFASYLAAGESVPDAARKAFKWKIETDSKSYERARTIARSARVQREIERLKTEFDKRREMAELSGKGEADPSRLLEMAIDRLRAIRDDPQVAARHRINAIEILDTINDPSREGNLIWRYLDLIWDGAQAHCPACHNSFPLWKVKNDRLKHWRLQQHEDRLPAERPTSDLDRRVRLLKSADRRNRPHKSQVAFLSAPERHAIGTGPARVGKSQLLGMWAYLFLLIPGSEVWILARIYDDAESEMEYLVRYLSAAFFPESEKMFTFTIDKTGEAKVETRWGSVLKIKSAKSKGSITGRELEACLVAEPAWVDGDLFEEVRARLSSRLGRLIALGTPKGLGGFIGRMMRMTGRDVRTGKRLAPGGRLVANGCPWGQSIFQYQLKPADNPAYVTSELEAARMELTASEFASEFEGLAVGEAGRKFPHVTENHRQSLSPQAFDRSVFVLGIDQGERNFAACLVAWDGVTIRVSWEYFDNTDKTIKANMVHNNEIMPGNIRRLGANPDAWQLTIFDADPVVATQLSEMEAERREWKTPITLRPKGGDVAATWRDETCVWIDQMANDGRLLYSAEHCDLLHEQVMEAMRPPESDSSGRRKNWVINDPVRGDHVVNAFLLACWTIYSGQLVAQEVPHATYDAFEEARRAAEYKRQVAEKQELSGSVNAAQVFEEVFERPLNVENAFFQGFPGYFSNES